MITRFGAYEILYELKTGGMGAVLLGRRRGPGAFEQLVAIKIILASFAQAPAVRAMFLDEAAILARLSHPAIATVHDFGEQGGTLYMVMEYVAGIPFRDVMQYGLPPAVAARAIAEACRGVHAAHELRDLSGHLLGVVHRDVSPDNLMFGFDGHIKVIDFGIALVKNRQAPVTELGMLKGKPPYMSPEQVKNEPVDRRSDVFSLAVVLWELLTGQALFGGDSLYAVALAVEQQDIEPPSQVLGEALPHGLDAVVMNALERDPARRTPSAAAFAEQLEQVVQTAGDETLEAWADRVLAEPRTAHRAWLASVAAGRDAPRPIGRPTGAVTALAPPPDRTPGAGPGTPPAERSGFDATELAADVDQLAAPSRRRVALPVVLGAIVLAMIAGGVAFVVRAGKATSPAAVAAHDAALAVVEVAGDASLEVAPPLDVPPDAAPDAPPDLPGDVRAAPPDASPAPGDPRLDAPPGERRRRRPRAPPDAGVATGAAPRTAAPGLDAARGGATAADAAPPGWGTLTAKHQGERYLQVVLDGRMLGPTPVFKLRVPAGTHVVELVDPRTSEVVVRRTVTVDVGQPVTVQP